MTLGGKTAIVTGGNSGIGKAIATALARAGTNVVIAARRQPQNEKVAASLTERFGVKTLPLKIDVSREADCEQLVERTVEAFGALHVLVNNAGIIGGNEVAATSTAAFDRVLKTNLYGTSWCSRAAFRMMQSNRSGGEPRGMIINISSVAGKQGWKSTGASAHRNSA
jgi:NAD(P)-dependent dehydrogenase (short-subunit alcohol dehydrogenase family)